MKSASGRSIQTFVRAWTSGFVLTTLLLTCAFFVKYADDAVSQHFDLSKDLIQLYSDDSISIEFGRKNIVYVEDALRRLNLLLNGTAAHVRSNSGEVVASTSPAEIGSSSRIADNGFTVLAVPIREHSSGELLGTLEVAINRNVFLTEAYKKALPPALALLAILLTLSVFMIRSLRKQVVDPIRQLLSPDQSPCSDESLWPIEIRDLSARLQNALKQRDLVMIGQISSGILHDLKTSLHSLKTGVELAKSAEQDSQRRTKCLDLLLKAADHHVPKMEAIVSNTLDSSRNIQVQAVDADIRATLSDSITAHAEMIDRYKVDISVTEFNKHIQHDPVQMGRVFSNILKNAIEATADGEASCEKRVAVSLSEDSEFVALSIDDSGPGLSARPDKLLQSMTSTKAHGSGLGLWVSRKIIEAHRGSLTAGKSPTLPGARFEIRIPKEQGASS